MQVRLIAFAALLTRRVAIPSPLLTSVRRFSFVIRHSLLDIQHSKEPDQYKSQYQSTNAPKPPILYLILPTPPIHRPLAATLRIKLGRHQPIIGAAMRGVGIGWPAEFSIRAALSWDFSEFGMWIGHVEFYGSVQESLHGPIRDGKMGAQTKTPSNFPGTNMPKSIFHSSIEGAQHGPKGLENFLAFAKDSGAAGAQPSNYMLEAADDGTSFKSAAEIRDCFEKNGLKIDGFSAHCAFWVHTSAWTGTRSGHPFIHGPNQDKSPEELEQFYEDYILRLMDLCAELNVKILPMFWGVAFGWELATGYPWGFWAGPGFDLMKEGQERFVTKTAKIRSHANSLGIYLAHEIHPGTAAVCADEFNMLVDICDGDKCLAVNADPSHCWEGEDWETRFNKVGSRVYGCHVKNYTIHPNIPLRKMEPDWHHRAMQFTDLATGDLNMTRYAEVMMKVGYPKRYCEVMGTDSAPLVVEAESNYRDGDATSADGIAFVRDNLCFPAQEGSFEDAMGA